MSPVDFVPDKKIDFTPDSKSTPRKGRKQIDFRPDDSTAMERLTDEKPSLGGFGAQLATGFVNSAAFGVPELVAKDKFRELESESQVERVGRGVGTTLGFVAGVPGFVFKTGSKLALKALGKSAPKIARLSKVSGRAKKGTDLAKAANQAKVAQSAAEGAGGGILFAAADPSVPLEEKPKAMVQNAAAGAVAGATLEKLPQIAKSIIEKRRKTPQKAQEIIEKVNARPMVFTDKGVPVQSTREGLTPTFGNVIPKEAKSLIDELDRRKTEILAADRGVIPFAKQKELARTVKIDKNFYDSIRPGTTANAETMWAMRIDQVKRIGAAKTKEEFQQLSDDIIKADAVLSETARSLGSVSRPQMLAAEQLKFLGDQIKNLPPEGQKAAQKLFGQLQTPGFWDKFMEYRTAALLTSPFTHARNIIGNTIPRVFNPAKKVVAGGIDATRSLATGKQREVFAREGVADMVGVIHGVKPAIRNALRSLADENYVSTDRIMEAVRHGQSIGGIKGKIIRLPFRALTAMDEFFSTLGHNASLYSQATRQAIKEGSKDVAGRAAQLIKNPSPEMISRAAGDALEDTFRQPLGPAMRSVQTALEKSKVGKFIVPFFRTPVNLFKWSFDRGPTSLVSPANWKAISKGSAEEQANAVANIVLGQTISAGIAMQVVDGSITGRLSDKPAEREALMRQGIQPYSIKVGDKYISYRSYEPLSSWLALVANATEISQESGKFDVNKVGTIVAETAKMLKDQSFLRGISDLTNALDDPDRYGERFIQNSVTSLIPTGVGYLSRLYDPVIRDPGTIPEAIKAKLPYFSKGVPERLDVWGNPITKEGTLVEKMLLPSGAMTSKPSLMEEELLSLEKFPRKIAKKYRGIKLSTEERNNVTRVEGRIAKSLLERAVQTSEYQRMNATDQRKLLDKVLNEVRTEVRKVMIEPILRQRLRSMKTQEERLQLLEDFTNKKLIKR